MKTTEERREQFPDDYCGECGRVLVLMPSHAERDEAIANARRAGASLDLIGERFRMTNETVRRICKALEEKAQT